VRPFIKAVAVFTVFAGLAFSASLAGALSRFVWSRLPQLICAVSFLSLAPKGELYTYTVHSRRRSICVSQSSVAITERSLGYSGSHFL
jgi:hypothetical protein